MSDFSRGTPVLERTVLNAVQKEAVSCTSWPQLVFAGAGSGKTRVLTAKIAYLIEHEGAAPVDIFAATFTNKAAREMRERVEQLLGISCAPLWIGTFHSMCARLLRREATHLGYPANYTIYDRDDQLSLVKRILKEEKLDERSMPPRAILEAISRFKNACAPFEKVDGTGESYRDRHIVRIYGLYQQMLKRSAAMDFDDLITNTVYLFRTVPEVLARYQNRFQYVLVDEYQDTNTAQFNLVELLGAGHRRIFVVGDDDQSIYGWRGAQIENILSFASCFEGTRTFKLEQNYRSTQPVLDFAHAIISRNTGRADKRLWTDRDKGPPVSVNRYRDDRQEATEVARKIRLLAGKGCGLGEIAVLFRTNAQSRALEEALRKDNTPYVLVGATSFYERKEIKDCLAYLRLIVNAKDDVSCARILNVPTRGIGAKSLAAIFETAAARGMAALEFLLRAGTGAGENSKKGVGEFTDLMTHLMELNAERTAPAEILEEVLDLTGYRKELQDEDTVESQSRLENIGELLNAVAIWSEDKPEGTLEAFLEEVSLATDVDSWERRDSSVNLMTLHCAKGLEFKAVFLVGLEDGLFPLRQSFEDPRSMEEERRLLYVGATRAMETLECSYADQRYRFGSLCSMMRSRFLDDVPEHMCAFSDHSSQFGAPRAPRNVRRDYTALPRDEEPPPREKTADDFTQETVEFRMGQQVSHKSYGRGKILSVSGFGPDMQLTVLFKDGCRRKMMAKFVSSEAW